jgi:hypothetical protein
MRAVDRRSLVWDARFGLVGADCNRGPRYGVTERVVMAVRFGRILGVSRRTSCF